MAPSGPALFSTSSGWPTDCETELARMRVTMSVEEPAGNGTTTRTGFPGNCAAAVSGAARSAASAATANVLSTSPHESSSLILIDPSDIKRREAKLQPDERPGVVVESPQYPERVAGKEAPETDGALMRRARSDQIGRRHRDEHGGPLQEIEIVHGKLGL